MFEIRRQQKRLGARRPQNYRSKKKFSVSVFRQLKKYLTFLYGIKFFFKGSTTPTLRIKKKDSLIFFFFLIQRTRACSCTYAVTASKGLRSIRTIHAYIAYPIFNCPPLIVSRSLNNKQISSIRPIFYCVAPDSVLFTSLALSTHV